MSVSVQTVLDNHLTILNAEYIQYNDEHRYVFFCRLGNTDEIIELWFGDFDVRCLFKLNGTYDSQTHDPSDKYYQDAITTYLLTKKSIFKKIDSKKDNNNVYINKINIIEKYLYYGYNNAKTVFAELLFSTKKDMQKYLGNKSKLQNLSAVTGGSELVFLEQEIDPMLNYMRITGLSIGSYIKIDNVIDIEGNSVKVSHENISKYNPPIVTPFYPLICSIDIEVYNDTGNGFPQRHVVTHIINMISVNFKRYKSKDDGITYVIVVGDRYDTKVENVIFVANEYLLQVEFFELIKKHDPDVISGFNIAKFDFWYMKGKLSIYDTASDTTNTEIYGKAVPDINRGMKRPANLKSKYTKLFGHQGNVYTTIKSSGRSVLDVMLYVLSRYRLPQYSLNSLSEYFLGDKKHDVKAEEMFAIYRRYTEGDPTGMDKFIQYCIQDTVLTAKLFDKLTVYEAMFETSVICGINPDDCLLRGQMAKVGSLIMRVAHVNDVAINHRKEAVNNFSATSVAKFKYEGGYVRLNHRGLHKGVFSADFNSLYPSIMMAYNISPDTQVHGLVNDCDPVNILHTEMTPVEKVDEEPEQSESDEDEHEQSESGEKDVCIDNKKVYKMAYVKPDIRIGILPRIVRDLIAQRKRVRAQMAVIKEYKKGGMSNDELLQKLHDLTAMAALVIEDITKIDFCIDSLNIKQEQVKVMCNSCYGICGTQYERSVGSVECAASITQIGRCSIKEVSKWFEERGFIAAYNDTDSIYAYALNPTTIENDRKRFLDLLSELNTNGVDSGLLRPPMFLAFESDIQVGLFINPKMYAYRLTDGKFSAKGIVSVRRDICDLIKTNYNNVLHNILDLNSYQSSIEIIDRFLYRMLNEEVSFDDVKTVVTYKGSYKSENCKMSLFGLTMSKEGLELAAGSRVYYVIIYIPGNVEFNDQKLGCRMATFERYEIMKNMYGAKIDIKYYLENLTLNSLGAMFFSAYGESVYISEFSKLCNKYQITFKPVKLH